MLLGGVGCAFMAFIMFCSGIPVPVTICASKGSSVDLPCLAQHHNSSPVWFIVYWDYIMPYLKKLAPDGNRVSYSKESNFTLRIDNITESDSNLYCCRGEEVGSTITDDVQLQVTDLQVKVIPTTEGRTVTLWCSTGCPLFDDPAAYIWYRNSEFLYEDWSPWYQQLVGSEEAANYSCAIRGREDLRTPEVSVDSVTSSCVTVSYAEGRMCFPPDRTSVDRPCSITYPREIQVQRGPRVGGEMSLTCNTSCPSTAISWYFYGHLMTQTGSEIMVGPWISQRFSCSPRNNEDIHSAPICVENETCWSVTYVSSRICALEGSSVNITSEYMIPSFLQHLFKAWYKIKRRNEDYGEELREDTAGHVEYHDNMENRHILTVNHLERNDSAEYRFSIGWDDDYIDGPYLRGVTLIVTGLKVTVAPSADVTEGQRVTLTCSTSCPLTDAAYIWYLNGLPLTLPGNRSKRLVLDPVNGLQAGNYSCAVNAPRNISSHEKTLTVRRAEGAGVFVNAGVFVRAAILALMVATGFWCFRRKRRSSRPPAAETSPTQVNPEPTQENPSAEAAPQDEHHYCRLHFLEDHCEAVYSSIRPGSSS